MMVSTGLSTGIIFLFVLMSGPVFAQATDNLKAGVVERTSIPQEEAIPNFQIPLIEPAKEEAPSNSTVKVLVKDFNFEGNQIVSAKNSNCLPRNSRTRNFFGMI